MVEKYVVHYANTSSTFLVDAYKRVMVEHADWCDQKVIHHFLSFFDYDFQNYECQCLHHYLRFCEDRKNAIEYLYHDQEID